MLFQKGEGCGFLFLKQFSTKMLHHKVRQHRQVSVAGPDYGELRQRENRGLIKTSSSGHHVESLDGADE